MNMSLLKLVIHSVVQPFANICIFSCATGIFQAVMKIAKVISIYITRAKDEFNNHTPISLLPQYSKILEKLCDERLEKFIIKIIFRQTDNLASKLAVFMHSNFLVSGFFRQQENCY